MPHQRDTLQYSANESDMLQGQIIPPGCTILVVDGSGSNFILIERMLGCLGIYCEWKPSGYKIIEFANSLPRIDLILIDILLPYEDGFCALKDLRNSDQFQGVPILATAFNANNGQMIGARVTGFDGFLGKSLDPESFPDQIRRILCGERVWGLN
jgi:two-component system cell cycle response regulator DivK